jgi:hypothetical protein
VGELGNEKRFEDRNREGPCWPSPVKELINGYLGFAFTLVLSLM